MEWIGEKKIGRWTVLGPCMETERGERKWLCRCDCGTERYVLERSLRYGGSFSCGCVTKERRLAAVSYDLTGMVFGNLTVLRRSKKPSTEALRGIWWVCRCSCGNECTVLASSLVHGKKTHCGCKRKSYRDITGRRYHSLTVLYPLSERSERGEVIWHCRCDCGNEIDATYNALAYSNLRSCGCKKQEHSEKIQNFLTRIDGTSIDRIRSKRLSAANTTGVKGVYYHQGKWVAKIVFQKKQYHLGRFPTLQEAKNARQDAEKLLFEGSVTHYERWKILAESNPAWAENNPIKISVARNGAGYLVVTFLPEIAAPCQ